MVAAAWLARLMRAITAVWDNPVPGCARFSPFATHQIGTFLSADLFCSESQPDDGTTLGTENPCVECSIHSLPTTQNCLNRLCFSLSRFPLADSSGRV